MIGFEVKFERELERNLKKRLDKGFFRSISNAAYAIRSTALRLITKSKDASPEGEPIHTRRGRAKRPDAILYDADHDDAVIGFTHHAMGESMEPHEKGGEYRGQTFPERSVLGPALDANLVRFADEFRGSLGE